jgi:hypothetical protein
MIIEVLTESCCDTAVSEKLTLQKYTFMRDHMRTSRNIQNVMAQRTVGYYGMDGTFPIFSMKTGTGMVASWSQRSCGLRHEPSSPARILGSWVRIPLEAWVSMYVYSVFVVSCVQISPLRRAEPQSKKFYRLCKRSRNWKSGQGPTKGCRDIDVWNHHNHVSQFLIIFVLADRFSGRWI